MMSTLAFLTAAGLAIHAPDNATIVAVVQPYADPQGYLYLISPSETVLVPGFYIPAHVSIQWRDGITPDVVFDVGGNADVNLDGDNATDKDIEAFWDAVNACEGNGGSSADWDNDGTGGTTDDIAGFFKSLGGS